MAKKFPLKPKHPEKICWGCDKYCSAKDLQCGNGSERIQHPIELDGEEWYRKGDWRDLLSEEQLREVGMLPENNEVLPVRRNGKPHFKIPIKPVDKSAG